MLDERTPCQRAGLIAYYFGQGEGLTRSQIRKLSGSSELGTSRLMTTLRSVLDLHKDTDKVWSSHYGKPLAPQTPKQRAIVIAYELAITGCAHTGELAQRLGVSRAAIYKMLCGLSIVLPIYYDEHSRTWKVLDLRELD